LKASLVFFILIALSNVSAAFASECSYSFDREQQNFLLSRLKEINVVPFEGVGAPEAWPIDGFREKDEDYSLHLSKAFRLDPGLEYPKGKSQYRFFRTWANTRKVKGKSSHVLDLFGSGFQIENPSEVDSVTGLRFGPFLLPNREIHRQREEVLGDILNPTTWAKLDQSMAKRGIVKFDLVTMLPIGGWSDLKMDFSPNAWSDSDQASFLTFKHIILNTLSRLSSDGVFYFKLYFGMRDNNLSLNPELSSLISEIREKSDHELILSEEFSDEVFYGALIPKPD
jgi:hypothetical protein